MPHSAVLGMTSTGKSWYTKRVTGKLATRKQQLIVHSGTGDTDFPPGAKIVFHADQLEELLNDPDYFGAYIVIDEATILYRDQIRRREHPMCLNLGQLGRHHGFTCFFLTQYPTGLPHNVRVNCPNLVCFRLGARKYAEMVRDDWGLTDAEAKEILQLPPLHALTKKPMQPVGRIRLS